MTVPLVIFSDLDGTLLDHETYSFEPAKPALDSLKEKAIPLVLASSKTATEIQDLRRAMGFDHCPAIVENGAGILAAGQQAHKTDSKVMYQNLRDTLDTLPAKLRLSFASFGDWSIDEIAARTGLSPSDARKAASRQFSEPGIWQGKEADLPEFLDALADKGLYAKRGGRFLTVSFGGSKGDRVTEIMALYSDSRKKPLSLALGDAPNDAEMMEAADMAYIIPNASGVHIPPLQGEREGNILRCGELGPTGWNTSVLSILKKLNL